jgi:hypothetical protein
MNHTYTIEKSEHGIIVRGGVPVSDLVALQKAWRKQGYDTLAIGVAAALGATLAICRKDNLKAWELELNKQAQQQSNGDAEIAWLCGTDTGTSSKTIFSVLSEKNLPATVRLRPDVPHDPDDFGRCYRLLEQFPAWRSRLPEVAAKYPQWGPLVREWERLSHLFEQESPTMRCPKLYDAMKALIEEGRLAAGWVKTGPSSWKSA